MIPDAIPHANSIVTLCDSPYFTKDATERREKIRDHADKIIKSAPLCTIFFRQDKHRQCYRVWTHRHWSDQWEDVLPPQFDAFCLVAKQLGIQVVDADLEEALEESKKPA